MAGQTLLSEPLTDTAQLALDTIYQRPVKGIPTWLINPMEWRMIDRLAELPEGSYEADPVPVYRQMLLNIGCCLMDQWIPHNPLSMGSQGYEGASHGATTGAEEIVLDGMVIDSPEAVVAHLEQFEFPRLAQWKASIDVDARVQEILDGEAAVQAAVGPTMLKGGYGFIGFPGFGYYSYGYANYFMAFALYPEVMERHFALQADCWELMNQAAARVYAEEKLPPIYRLDHDMADSRGMLVNITELDRIWFPHFARALAPVLATDVKLIWHCDGNLMDMVPRLLEVGIKGFQGFQYEDGMDYERICAMKDRDGNDLIIIGGVSVTRTLPMGTAADVKREMRWLVDNGPRTGLFLGGSSSITPGVPWENLQMLADGFNYYREHGR